MANITNSLLENIEAIQSVDFNEKKIKETNQTVTTILNVFKTEAAILKIKKGK